MNTVVGRCQFLQEWSNWDTSIHADDAQIDRQGRSMTYPFDFEINHDKETARFSSTTDIPYYETTLSHCTCHDFQERKLPCKHMYRLAVELGIIKIINRLDKERVQSIKDSDDIDAQPEQVQRIKRAKESKCAPLSIDYAAQTAIFAGSGKKPYETTVDSCTCRDYFVRRLPCKHIYRLRIELEKTPAE